MKDGKKLAEEGAQKSGTAGINKKLGIAVLTAACLALFMIIWKPEPSALLMHSKQNAQKIVTESKTLPKEEPLLQESQERKKVKKRETIVVTYHKEGNTGPMRVSQAEIAFHVGQKVHIKPDATSRGAGMLRLMTTRGEPDVYTFEKAGKIGPHTSTEMILTGKSEGVKHCQLVPNYGEWKHAVKMTFRVVE